MDNKTLLHEALSVALSGPPPSPDNLDRHFTPDYVQHVDGRRLSRAAFAAHLGALRRTASRIDIEILQLFGEGDALCSRHLARVTHHDGHRSTHLVHAVFRLEHGRIAACHELTRLLDGTAGDHDLGAR